MSLRVTRLIGIALNLTALAVLLAALLFRTRGLAEFLSVGIWTGLPYGLMVLVHWRFRRTRAQSVVSLLISVGIAAFGLWLTVDALFINFGPLSAGIAMFIAPLCQLPAAVFAALVSAFIERSTKRALPSNPALNTDAQQASLPRAG